jgi:pimeloyl-ACP methyl ester carboxylesterase
MGAAAAWVAYSNMFVDHNHPIERAIDAEPHTLVSPSTGRLNYYVDGRGAGRPLVLVHSVNAAGSSYEMRPIFEQVRGSRPLYALDLPGFGFSERSDRVYTPELYTQALVALLRQLGTPGGADVVALSLGCEFAALAAQQHPELVHSLSFISPTGFSRRTAADEQQRLANSARLHQGFSMPLWSQPFFDLLTTRASIKYYLDRLFVGQVDQGLLDYDYATAHQPGARHAPLYFISGALFTPDIRNHVYAQLSVPVLIIYDECDEFVSYDSLREFVTTHELWYAERVTPSQGLPQFEMPDAVIRVLNGFWESIPSKELAREG